MSKLGIFFDHNSDKEIQKNNNELTYPFKKIFNYKIAALIPVAVMCASSVGLHAATLEQRAVYQMKILVAGDPAQIGQCSSFAFGDISAPGCANGPFEDNINTSPLTDTLGGNGVIDGLAGIITIETAKADLSGNNTFTVINYQLDPYLATAGGTFKTTMTPPLVTPPVLSNGKVQVAAVNNGSGTLTAVGGMTLSVDGRTGIAGGFFSNIGYQEWNRDDTTKPNVTTETGLYEPFTTGVNANVDPTTGLVNVSLTGRDIADTAPADGILDAILVSAGNVSPKWTGFNGVPYTEGFNVQFVLVSAKPVAKDDVVTPAFTTPMPTTISVADLLANDSHAAGTFSLDSVSATVEAANGSTVTINGDGTSLTYNAPTSGGPYVSDSFDYTIIDGAGITDTATATLLFPIPPAPTAVDDNPASFDEDTELTLNPIANDVPNDSDTLVLFSFDGVSANLGTVVAAGGDSVTYTPPENYFGLDSFNYVVHDQNGNLDTAVVNLIVDPVNDPLVCTDLGLSTTSDVPLLLDINADLLSTCTDVETTDTITLASWSAATPQGGAVTSDGSTLTYTPALGFSGTDTFTYTANDGTVDDVPRTVTVTVGNFGNFTMLLKATGNVFGGTNDVIFDWPFFDAVAGGDLSSLNSDTVDYTNNLKFDMAITSSGPHPFFGSIWYAHSIRVFGPGTYSFDSGCTNADIVATGCPAGSATPSGPTVTMTVGDGQVGAHILFDYSSDTNIDVLNVWDINGVWDDPDGTVSNVNDLYGGAAGSTPDPATTWKLVSRDVNGDGINGMPMVDGSFIGYYANFNDSPAGTAAPLADITGSAGDTKLGSGALGLVWLFGMLPAISFFRRRFRKEQ